MTDREAFEKHMLKLNVCTRLARQTNTDGSYRTITVQRAWELWQEAIKQERARTSKPRDAFAEAAAMEPKPCDSCDGTMIGDTNGYTAFLRCQKCNMVPPPKWAADAIRARSSAPDSAT